MSGRTLRGLIAAWGGLLTAAAPAVSGANTVHFEAESVRDRQRGTITSPLLIRDDPAASGGGYLSVAGGTNSPSGAPASSTEGVARYTFSVSDSGSYRIWARVSAPSDADDSFWIRVGGSAAWIRWNGIPLGAAYHWVLVRAEGASGPASFALTGGADHELQVAYREDGTRLDAFFITNAAGFDPNAALSAPPALPFLQPIVTGATAVKVSWSAVPGASSYTVERRPTGCTFDPQTQCCEPAPYQVIQSGLTAHTLTDTVSGSFAYRVTALAATGSSAHPVPQGPEDCVPFDPSAGSAATASFHLRTQTPVLAVTSPMRFFAEAVGAPAGTDSLGAPPAHGRARLDFQLAQPTVLRVWAEVTFPNPDQDSFWVRMNDGAWVKWNNLDEFCEDVHDSSKSGSPTVLYQLPAGSHRIEWAHREGGARLADNIIVDEDPGASGAPPCAD